MNPFVYFILYTAFLFVSYRIALFLSFLISISVSLFILIFQKGRLSYEAVMFILFFNVLPFITNRFKKNFNNEKAVIRGTLEKVKASYDELILKDKQQIESNLEVERRMHQVSSLYEISKDMSGCLTFEDIFNIFSSALKKSFRFKVCRILLLKDSDSSIESAYQIELGNLVVQSVPDNFDKELAGIAFESRKELVISAREEVQFLKRLSVIRNFETLISVPIIAEEKVAGVLYIENIPRIYFENFIILAGQFAIQLQKVILYKKVQEMSITDSLTGVETRRYFLERFSEEVRRSMRHKSNLAFLMLDLDHFKEKNDRYGHLVGDVVLKDVANIIKSNLREIDIIGRYGGEEFSVVLAGTGKDGALQVAERLRLGIEKAEFKAYDEVVSTTISIGASIFPDDGVSIGDLIESADKALYRAKESGRNRVM